MNDRGFDAVLVANKKIKSIVTAFLDNSKAENFKNLLDKMLTVYHKMGCNMSVKMNY